MILYIQSILLIIILILTIINLSICVKKDLDCFVDYNLNNIHSKLSIYYDSVNIKTKNLFNTYPEQENNLKFGYICPGATKTVEFLNKSIKLNSDIKIKNEIKKLTDLQFFIEIIVIYNNYITDKKLLDTLKNILDNKGCEISTQITNKITNLMAELSPEIKDNIPDNFYHIRHNTLICSRDKKLAEQRIQLLKNLYKNQNINQSKIENFANNNNYKGCLGMRDGVSGCRDCCSIKYNQNYSNCVNSCMEY